MKIISWNLNGLLSCVKHNSFQAIEALGADVVCCQEIRTKQQTQVMAGYQHFWNPSERDGYSGTLTMTRKAPICEIRGLGVEALDCEGRVVTLEFPKLFIVNAYAPNSQKNLQRHQFRTEWDEAFRGYVCSLAEEKPVVACGDFNVAMSDIDIYPENLRQYWAQMGYASDERSNLETLMESGFTDAFRYLYDVMAALGEIEAAPPKGTRQKKEIPENWKHIKLKQYFAACTAASVTLTFKEIEKIDGRPLPASARKNKDWWYPRQNCNMMAEAWLTEGYSLKYINFEKGKIQLVRDELGRSKLEIPKALTSQKLPDNAVFELQQHMAYIIKKYQL